MKIGPDGVELIKAYEKCILKSYKPTPNDIWTCGWGSTTGVTEDTVWTQDEADDAFLRDIVWVEACVNRCVTSELLQNEFDALCSLCFNIGCGAFGKSTLVKEINSGNFDAAAKEFKVWNKQNHKELAGLTARREKEMELFEKAQV